MWAMTLAAADAFVQVFVVGGLVMARRAVADLVEDVGRTRVWVMAAGAGTGFAVFGMIGGDVFMAGSASGCRRTLDIVRVVAVRAVVVGSDASPSQDEHSLVAALAPHGVVFFEVVRAVTAHAIGVSFEESRFADNGSLGDTLAIFVAVRAGIPRVAGRRVLVRMAGRTRFYDGLVGGGVGRVHIVVALVARCRFGTLLLMRLVARNAFLRVVHHYRWGIALPDEMTACAVAGRVRLHRALMRRVLRQFGGEGVTGRAISRRCGAELGPRLRACVLELGFLLVTVGAPRRHYRPNLGIGELMTVVAGNLLLDDVEVVPVDGAGGLPVFGDVDAAARRTAGLYV